ncbi:hypothetical protein [Rubrivivax rivuli]|uniref:Uncharacterized protein n=1 Tax=Rubrivivax rivuli TaxID=1862385 RepID=A0A437R939_9BURK|nr:hypothetical protein [Rubrivivax rivuli]RVU43253.1 hypothetical protein EOE66_20085 [Rubrivivax rivuli]
MSLHELSLEAATPGERRLRDVAAALLRLLSHTLGLLAERVAPPPAVAPVEPLLEFHAEAGAPEGALYVNGQLVGHLPGVHRL